MIAGYFAAAAFIFLLAGLGPTFAWLPERHRRHGLLTAPFLGCGFLGLIAQNCSALGLSIGRAAPVLWVWMGASAALFFYAVRKEGWVLFWKDQKLSAFWPGLMAAGALLFPILQAGYLTWFGGGTDATGYIRYAYYLSGHALSEPLARTSFSYPWYGWVFAEVKNDFLGTSFCLGVLSHFLGKDPLELFNVLMAFYGFLTPIAVYLALEQCLQTSEKAGLFAAWLVGVQGFWLMAGYTTFLNQFGGIPFFILLFGFIYASLHASDGRLSLFCGFLIAVIYSYYASVLAISVCLAAAYAAVRLLRRQINPGDLAWAALAMILIPVLLHNALLPQYYRRATNFAAFLPKSDISPFYQSVPQYVSVFFNLVSMHVSWVLMSGWLRGLICLTDLALAGFFISSLRRFDGDARVYVLASCVVFAAFALVPVFQKQYYAFWKVLSYAHFLILACVALELSALLKWKPQPWQRFAVSFALVGVFIYANLRALDDMVHAPLYFCGRPLLQLSEIQGRLQRNPLRPGEGVALSVPANFSPHEWLSVAYVMRDVPLVLPQGGGLVKDLIFDRAQPAADLKSAYVLEKTGRDAPSSDADGTVWSDEDYRLLRAGGRL